MPSRRRVALLIETSNAYARGLLHGIDVYLREHGGWSIYLAEQGRGDRAPSWLDHWAGDGIIARVETQQIAEVLAPLRIPIIDVSSLRPLDRLPCFESNDAAIARLAFDHLHQRGFRHFAFCGLAGFKWSYLRGSGFQQCVREAGYSCAEFPDDGDSDQVLEKIARWIEPLPKPVAVFCCYDLRGQRVLDACRRLDIDVPGQVAVVGVDNDELLCSLSDPPLTSVVPNTRRTGYEAAALLERVMAGETPEPQIRLIDPVGIVTRQSSDVYAVDDPHLAKAMRFIRENATNGLSVEQVVRATGLSRRLLETRFRKTLGMSPHQEIVRVQIERVKSLLAGTDLSMVEIAERTGFEHVEYLSVAFKRETGRPPSQFRKEQRGLAG